MLPFGGQGSNQAMEDAAALGYIFTHVTDPAAIERRLSLFEKARKNRVARVQILSKVRLGRESEVEQEVKKYAEPAGSGRCSTRDVIHNNASEFADYAESGTYDWA